MWLEGKKTILVGCLSAVNSYLVAASMYDANMGALIQSLLLAVSGGAVYATVRMNKAKAKK